jgi:hypothetical protein
MRWKQVANGIPGDMARLGKKARLWAKKRVEKESSVLGDADELSVLPADFIIPHENNYSTPPPMLAVRLRSLELLAPANSIQSAPFTKQPQGQSQASAAKGGKEPELLSHPATVNFSVSIDDQVPEGFSFSLAYDVSFVTAHPCTPSRGVRFLKSPTSPTIQQIDVSGSDLLGKSSRPAHRTGKMSTFHFSWNAITDTASF